MVTRLVVLIVLLSFLLILNVLATEDCHVIRQVDLKMIPRDCTEKASGYICQKFDCASCESMGTQSQVCLLEQGRCLVFSRKPLTWLQAKEKCQKRRYSMANITVPRKHQAWMDKTLNCKDFWVDIPKVYSPGENTTHRSLKLTTGGTSFLQKRNAYEASGSNRGQAGSTVLKLGVFVLGVINHIRKI